jgi:hypothetical protein
VLDDDHDPAKLAVPSAYGDHIPIANAVDPSLAELGPVVVRTRRVLGRRLSVFGRSVFGLSVGTTDAKGSDEKQET